MRRAAGYGIIADMKTQTAIIISSAIIAFALAYASHQIGRSLSFRQYRYEYHPKGSSFVVFDKSLGIVHYYDGMAFREINFTFHSTSTHEDFSIPDAKTKGAQ